jgi:phosphatidylcholine synthase
MVSKTQSWLVHVFTASGAFAGFLSLQAILNDNVFLAFLWLSVAFFIDGIDGTLARRYKVANNIPEIDGAILDNIVDYLNYVFIPALMVYWFELVPSQFSLFAVALILIVSCYTFANTKLKTEDLFFSGFPAVWNIVIFYLFVLDTSPLANFLAILFFSVMTFVPLKYLHPFRVKEKKVLNLFMTSVWGLCCALLLIDLREEVTALSIYRNIYYWLWVVLNFYFIYISLERSIFKQIKGK